MTKKLSSAAHAASQIILVWADEVADGLYDSDFAYKAEVSDAIEAIDEEKNIPLYRSNNRQVLSRETLSKNRSSELNARFVIVRLWPLRGSPTCFQDFVS